MKRSWKLCGTVYESKLTFKCYLIPVMAVVQQDVTAQLTVSLYYADNTFAQSKNSSAASEHYSRNVIAGKVCGTTPWPHGNEINEEGDEGVRLCPEAVQGRQEKASCLRLMMAKSSRSLMFFEPFKTYNHKLKVLNKIEETFYKDEGGLRNRCFWASELHPCRLETKLEVPLIWPSTMTTQKDGKVHSQKFLRVMMIKVNWRCKSEGSYKVSDQRCL